MNSKRLLTLGCLSWSLTFTPLFAQAACSDPPYTIDGLQILHGRNMNYRPIITTRGLVSDAIFNCDVENSGWVSNSTINPGVTLHGGVLTGYIQNNGTIADVVFVGARLQGGTLSGKITNNSKVGGTLEDVDLAANAQISGGTLKGTIVGDKSAPALLQNLKIQDKSILSGVILGNNVRLGTGVVIQ